MVLDTSVIIAIYFNEKLAGWALDKIESHKGSLLMSVVNLTECLILLKDRNNAGYKILREKLLDEPIKFIETTVLQGQIAAEARMRYPLNLGDCFAYAVCREHDDVLLALDKDFRKTDIKKILPM